MIFITGNQCSHPTTESPCFTAPCHRCCVETNMLLTNKDVDRIQALGYSTDFFVRYIDGWMQLQNRQGTCVFHDGTCCTIYEHRPEGCSLYPLVFLKGDNTVILDEDCPQRILFPRTKQMVKKVLALVTVLEQERTTRSKTMK
ncbi:MAG: YkgJ family cysteine cluster protein [Methanobacteriota archaeon]